MFNIRPFRCNLIRSLWNKALPCLNPNGIKGISYSSPLGFNITPALMMMPTKRKRKIDPQILRLREERKRRKLEKEIRTLERVKKTLRPIEEARMPVVLHMEMEARKRLLSVSEHVKEERILMLKEWSRYKGKQAVKDIKMIQKIVQSQEIALHELNKESTELYNAAIQIDPNLIPFTYEGPSDTPLITGYDRPDGEYIDISKNWYEDLQQKK